MKSVYHKVTISVRADKPCTRTHAVAMVKDSCLNNYYPMQNSDDYPGEFWVTNAKSGGK